MHSSTSKLFAFVREKKITLNEMAKQNFILLKFGNSMERLTTIFTLNCVKIAE
jgi:hypothetical protein